MLAKTGNNLSINKPLLHFFYFYPKFLGNFIVFQIKTPKLQPFLNKTLIF